MSAVTSRCIHLVRFRAPVDPVAVCRRIENGDVKGLKALLRRGANVNAMRDDGVTPLALAAARGQVEVTELLLKHGADPWLPTREGWYPYHFAKNAGDTQGSAAHRQLAAILLAATEGVEPKHDYEKAMLAKADAKKLAIYQAIYDEATLARKPFYNIGSGNWRHPYWTNVDYVSDYYSYDAGMIDLPWDISLMQPVEVETGAAELVYCSHTCEHLTDEQNRHMFREMRRILKPDGIVRITCPHAGLYYEAYKRRDLYASMHYGHEEPFGSPGVGYSAEEMSVWLVNDVASQTVRKIDAEHVPHYGHDPGALDRVFESMPMEAAFDHLCGLVDYEVHRKEPGCHINWWTPEKAVRELSAAGFSKTIISVAGGSISPVMRDRTYFDTVQPSFSIFVEGIA